MPLNSGIKKFMPKRGKSRFSIENLLSDSAEKFRRGTLLCCFSENFRYPKSLWMKTGGGGVPRASVEKFLSHSAEKLRKGIL